MEVKFNISWCGKLEIHSSVEVVLYSQKDVVVGLTYARDEQETPRIFYIGCGSAGKEFLRVARKYGMPISRRDALANYLYCFDVGDEVPSETYSAVADILAREYVK